MNEAFADPRVIHVKIGSMPGDYVRLHGRIPKELKPRTRVAWTKLGTGPWNRVETGVIMEVRNMDGKPLYLIERM